MSTTERRGAVTYRGKPLTLIGRPLDVGDRLPSISLLDSEWRSVTLDAYRGRPILISSIPSLDTDICDAQTRRLNAEAGTIPQATFATVSADMPWRLSAWAKEADVRHLILLSDHHAMAFGTATGTHVKEMRIDARAIFVADRDLIVVYAEIVPEIAQHPDYDAAIDAVRNIIHA